MTSLIWLGVWALAGSLILTPIFRDIFRSYNVVDCPDNGRKTHPHPIPRVGGIAVLISYFVAVYAGAPPGANLSLVWRLLPAALTVFAVGLIDDFLGLKPWQKLAGQLGAVGLACWSGVGISSIGGHVLDNWLSITITVAWLLACTNAFNLVDGLDGLAAGVGFFATLTIFTAALLHNNVALACATLPLAGCLLGFLFYNFNPATVFLGDCGSLLIGFLLGCYSIVWTSKSITLLGMTAPMMALSIPLADTLLAVARRFLRRQPIFDADRGHIHHRLIDLGITPKRAVLMIYGVCGLAAALSLLQSLTRNLYFAALILLLFSCVFWIGVRYLRYSEFILAGRLVRITELQRILGVQLAINSFARAITASRNTEDLWRIIRQHYREFGFSSVHLHTAAGGYHDGDMNVPPGECWTLRIPLGNGGYIEFRRPFHCTAAPMVAAELADILRDAESGKRGAARAAGASS